MSFLYMNGAPDAHVIHIDPETTQSEETKTTSEECRIRTILRIRRLPPDEFWSVAEQEWEENVKTSIGFIERRQARINSLTNEIYQLVGFSAAFQGLLLTAVSQASRLSCKTKWWVLILSMFATVVTAAGVRGKTKGVARFEDAVRQETPHKKSIMLMLSDLRRNGPERFDFCREEQLRERLLQVPNKDGKGQLHMSQQHERALAQNEYQWHSHVSQHRRNTSRLGSRDDVQSCLLKLRFDGSTWLIAAGVSKS